MEIFTLLAAAGVSPAAVATYAPLVSAVASLLSAIFPAPAEGSRWVPVRRILDILAMNFGHATNRTMADRLAVAITSAAWPTNEEGSK
jgi:hypothetical protein